MSLVQYAAYVICRGFKISFYGMLIFHAAESVVPFAAKQPHFPPHKFTQLSEMTPGYKDLLIFGKEYNDNNKNPLPFTGLLESRQF